MSDTPRTDAAEDGDHNTGWVPAAFAREIERELHEAQELMDDAQVLRKEYLARADAAEAALSELVRLKDLKDHRQKLLRDTPEGERKGGWIKAYRSVVEDYEQGKPLAWQRARELVRAKVPA